MNDKQTEDQKQFQPRTSLDDQKNISMNDKQKKKKKKKVDGYGVFVKAYGGLIGFSRDWEMANKLARTEAGEVSMSRSSDDFKVRACTITYEI